MWKAGGNFMGSGNLIYSSSDPMYNNLKLYASRPSPSGVDVVSSYLVKQWEAALTGDSRHFVHPLAAMVYPIGEYTWRVCAILEGGTKHLVASPPTHVYAPWWEYDPPTLRVVDLHHNGGASFVVSESDSSLAGVAAALFGESDAHLGQVIGPPCTGYVVKTPLDNCMFHDDQFMYSLYVTGASKDYSLLCWNTGDISTPFVPAILQTQYAWPDMTHVGGGRYIMVVRSYRGARKTLGVFLGSPWVGWEEVLPLAVKGTPLEPINVFCEYLHVDAVYYNYTTGECQLEGVLKDLSTGQYRFAKYSRRDFTDVRWKLIGKVQNIPDTGDLSFSVTSYGKGAAATRKFKLPNMSAAFGQTQSAIPAPLAPSWARFTNQTSGGIGPTYSVSSTR